MTIRENSPILPGDADRGEVQLLDTHTAWEGPTARVLVDRVRYPAIEKGGEHLEKEQFRLTHSAKTGHGVVIVPVEADGRIVLLRQFRHPVRMWLRELPRGASEEGESAAEAARRELHEELGLVASETFPLGRIANDSGQLATLPHIVVALVDHGERPEPENTEVVDGVFRYTYRELRRACWRGEILDSFTLCAVARLEPHVGEDGRFRYRPEEVAPPIEPEPE
jgi:8-oxo-dGTP pyrophosphatase MutT (NUDIX family)